MIFQEEALGQTESSGRSLTQLLTGWEEKEAAVFLNSLTEQLCAGVEKRETLESQPGPVQQSAALS